MLLSFCKLSTNSCNRDHTNSLQNDIKTVYKIMNSHQTNIYIFIYLGRSNYIQKVKEKKKSSNIHVVKNNLVENMNTNSPKWRFCSYIEYRISFTTLCLQKLVKNF